MKQNPKADVGIQIRVSVLIPSKKTRGKGVLLTRSEETTVVVDPTDVSTLLTVVRGCLANAQIDMPEAMMHDDDNEIYEVDMECPKCQEEKRRKQMEEESYKPRTAREKRIMAIADDLVDRGLATTAEEAFEQAEIIEKKNRQIARDKRSAARQKAKRSTVKKSGKGKRS